MQTTLGQYLTAAAAVGLAFLVRLALKPQIGNASPFLVFTPAVMLAAWYGGVGPAILATAAGATLGNHFFLRTLGEPGIEHWDRVALFLLVGGLITSMTTVLRTSRRRLAEALWSEQKARAEAEVANQTKDDFISLISHELQTPVSVVRGWAAVIRERHLHGEALTMALETIDRNAQLQSRLVRDLFDRARIANGSLRLEPQIVCVSEIVRAAVEQMRTLLDDRHLELTVAIGDSERSMSADPVRLQQVFTNLLSNAAKFTPPGGHIVVEAAYGTSTVAVTVKDDGVGISKEFLPHVFETFRQDSRTQSSSRGLGLGLSIARHFVERHGGTIRASSEGVGKGAIFTVVLPLQPQQAVRVPVALGSERSQRPHSLAGTA